jgi:hypothetical protein
MTQARLLKEAHGKCDATYAALYTPHPSLSGCVRAYLERSTIGAKKLTIADRCNYFPPTPTCVFVWIVKGQDSRSPAPDPRRAVGEPSLPVIFSGPHKRFTFSQNKGPVHFFTLLMYPDALRMLTGLAIEPHMDRYSNFSSVFDNKWQDMAHAVFFAQNSCSRIQIIEDFLRPQWEQARVSISSNSHVTGDKKPGSAKDEHGKNHLISAWTSVIAQRASVNSRELSDRQVARRIKTLTGQNLRSLRGLSRMESALLRINHAEAHAALAWGDLAIENGFSDQAHMCREFRRHFGMCPSETKNNLQNESAWVFRIWA